MLEPSKHPRIEHEDSPNRCQAIAGSHQCFYQKVEGSNYCDIHGGNSAAQRLQAEASNMYKLAKWQAQVGQFSNHSNLKSLREEIGILRMLLQAKLNICQTAEDLQLRSSSLSELVMKVAVVVEKCDKIDARMGKLVDRDQILILGEEIIKMVAAIVKDPEVLQAFSKQLVNLIANDSLEKRNALSITGAN